MTRRKAVPCLLCQAKETYNDDAICDPCRHDWKVGREIRTLAEAGGDEETEVFKSVDYWYFYAFAGVNDRITNNQNARELQRNLLALAKVRELETWSYRSAYQAKAIDVVVGRTSLCRQESSIRPCLAPKGTAAILQSIYSAIVNLMAGAYADGAREGGNLLHRLATGKTTVDEYNSWFTKKGVEP